MTSLKIRFLTAFLALTSVGGILASCGSPSATEARTTASEESSAATEAVTEPLDALDARRLVDDELGEFDFGGYEFKVYTSDYMEDNWIAEKTNGDVINDAVYKRNHDVGERFHVVIRPTYLDYGKLNGLINDSVMAGDDAIDLVSGHAVSVGGTALNDRFHNWYNIPHIDFSKPWWSSSNTEDLTYNDICLCAIGDAALSAMWASYCVFYNKTLGTQYNLPDLYEIVRNGQWTIDKITELSKDIYKDLDGDGEADDDDLYGYTTDNHSNVNAYLWAFDNPIFKKNGDTMEFVYKTEKISEIVPKISALFATYPGIHCNTRYKSPQDNSSFFYSRDMFAKSQSVFANGQISMSLTHFRELKDDYGILPYPKWDENQDAYHTMADGFHEVLCVPLTASDLERTGVITEALNAESYKTVVPAYYDVALKVKGARDPESIEMLDMIVDGRIFDFGYIYDSWAGCSFFLERLFGRSNLNFESYFAKREKHVMKHYNTVLEYFENYAH